MPRNILVTGSAGFIGSNFVNQFCPKHTDTNIISLDKLTYAGNLENIQVTSNNHVFIQGDICDQKTVQEIFNKYQITDVINFAAESHVDNSISGPDIFIKTNIFGTHNLLQIAYKTWMVEPHNFKKQYQEHRFLQISTDEVYGSLSTEEPTFTEKSPLQPNSPYSASKASADLLVQSYRQTYGLNTLITRCTNNYGPNQHAEKLIPTVIRTALSGKHIPIYGTGENIRDWIHVLDYCDAIEAVFFKGKIGNIYNAGGENEWSNIKLVKHLCHKLDLAFPKHTGSYLDQITYVNDRAGHDWRYGLNCKKIKSELSWSAKRDIKNFDVKQLKYIAGELLTT